MSIIKKTVVFVLQIIALCFICYAAYDVRMHAIRIYGLVIHEFDPWFNFRATQYLADNGLERFFKWYDYMSWSPLGRPVGTTIYPGMQMISVLLWNILNLSGIDIPLNDVCCYVPVWFGIFATLLLGCITWVASGSRTAGVCAAAVMAIIPAHLMRSVGGGFDNESVAISALCLTFLMWIYSLSGKDDNKVHFYGVLTGLAYTCMVAAWGGYIFVLNTIGVHALVLVLLGRFNNKLYWAYTMWYIVGTLGAMQVPVVGLAPVKSMEQLGPMGVFFIMQLLQLCESNFVLKFFKYEHKTLTTMQRLKVRGEVFGAAALLAAVVIMILLPTGYFGPLSSRVRGLFVQHTRTGNPLVDSVAEHQPASPQAYWQLLHLTCQSAPIGYAIALFWSVIKPMFKPKKATEESTSPMVFIVVYASVAYFFSSKMNRLMLLMGPICAALTGIAGASLINFSYNEALDLMSVFVPELAKEGTSNASTKSASVELPSSPSPATSSASLSDKASGSSSNKKKSAKKAVTAGTTKTTSKKSTSDTVVEIVEQKLTEVGKNSLVRVFRKMIAIAGLYFVVTKAPEFYSYCHAISYQLSNPSLMFQATLRDGTNIIVDDYREAYWWLRDNTPANSRIMAWWDYGYQITGIANRTTIADGNTWNHEHIALLGYTLTSPEKRAHKIAKHLADYVLIWAGGGGDDLAKSPHMARIASSVFDDHCPHDPTCKQFGFYNQQMDPTPMMAESLLYKLHAHRMKEGVQADPSLFREVFMSKYGKVRIFEVVGVSRASRNFTNSPENRVCDAPGSWYCTGQYPPALKKTLAKRKNFAQLEDFNVKKDEKSSKYHAEYMKKMSGQGSPPPRP